MEKEIEQKKIMQLLYGLSYALYEIKDDTLDLEKYKQGILKDVSLERIQEMKILVLLEKLGYSLNEIGTYLYKHMILKIVKYLNKDITSQNITEYKKLLLDLKDCYSNFYLETARFDLDMGIKTFHQNVIEAISKIDYDKIDLEVYNKIFGNIDSELDYGEQAFILGSYIVGNLDQKIESSKKNKSIVRVKKLINTPNIELKYKNLSEYV